MRFATAASMPWSFQSPARKASTPSKAPIVPESQVDFADYAQSLLRYLWRAQGSAASGIQLKVCLSVCDDGVGLPLDLDWENARSLGLRIVKTLARQLKAAVEVKNAHGAQFAILFER